MSLESHGWNQTVVRENLPVMGSRFSSRARSFDASCHSLVMVFGGGPAKIAVSTVGKETRRVLSGPTKCSACEIQGTSGEDANHDGQYEFWHAARRVEISSGSMRPKGDVVGCIYQRRVRNGYSVSALKPVQKEEKSGAHTGFFLVQ